jgi:tight adherence protein B
MYLIAFSLGTVVSLTLWLGMEFAWLAIFIYLKRPELLFAALPMHLLVKRYAKYYQIKKEAKLLDEQVGQFLLLLSQTLRAGMSLDQGFRLVESSLEKPIQEELRLIIKEVDLGKSWIRALVDSEEKIRSKEWQSFITATTLAINLGGNLSEILSGLANINNEKEAVQRKIKSITAQGRLTAYILAFLPLAFLGFYWFFDRSRILFFTNSLLGQILLVVAFLLDLAGYFVIRRICEVKW